MIQYRKIEKREPECACRKKTGSILYGLAGLTLLLCCLFLVGCGAADPVSGEQEEESGTADNTGSESSVMEDAAEIRTGRAALEHMLSDAGFCECVWEAAGLEEEDTEEIILQKLEHCENLILEESAYGEAVYSLEDLRFLPNLRYLVIDFESWDESRIEDFSPVAGLCGLEWLYISYSGEEETDLAFLAGMHTITELFLPECRIKDFSFLEEMS